MVMIILLPIDRGQETYLTPEEGFFPEPVSPDHQYQGFLVSISHASAGTSLPWGEPESLTWVITVTTLLRGAACELISVGRNSQERAGKLYLDPERWGKLSLAMVRGGTVRGLRRSLLEDQAVTAGRGWSHSVWLCPYHTQDGASPGPGLLRC